MSALTSPQFTLLVILLASSHCQTEEGITSHTPSPTTVHPPETGKYATQHRTSHKGTNQPDKTNKPPTYPPSLSRTNSRTQKSDGSCYQGDIVCEKDRLGYEAIATLHHQMDDDENGDIDLEESAEFLREELQSQWSDDRSKKFHMNDTHITINDLWGLWKNSSVHNWTVDQVVQWLTHDVELPQYSDAFRINVVDGCTLPRIAVNNLNFVSNILGIKNLVHKQKLANKATDVVLFGPPKSRHNWLKDVALIAVSVTAAGGLWFAYRQHKRLELTVAKTMADMDSLAKSEEALKELQVKLKREELEKRQHIQHKEKLEEQMKSDISEARREALKLKLTKEQTETQLSQMKETMAELEQTKKALMVAQKELEVRSSLTPVVELQKWLQITYELELKAYNEQKSLAEQQLFNAKDSCERLRKKKQALFGSLRMAHSGYIDETEHMIVSARKALENVKHDLAERQYRWQQIEGMCHFSIMSNPGIEHLIHSTGHTDLYKHCHGGKLLDATSSNELDEFEDRPPAYVTAVAGGTLPKPETNSVKNLAKVPNTVEGGSSRASVDHPQASSSAQSPVRLGLAAAAGNDSDNSSSPPPTKFNLDSDDQDSSSTSSNDVTSNIPPLPTRPPLQRAMEISSPPDAMSICSEQASSVSSVENLNLRARSQTSDSANRHRPKSRAKTINSPLASDTSVSTVSNPTLSNKNGLSGNSMKRSYTTPEARSSKCGSVEMSSPTPSNNFLNSAPAMLHRSPGTESDASLSSGSKDGESVRLKKNKKKLQLFKLFKAKPHTS